MSLRQAPELIAAILPMLRADESQMVYLQCLDDGPESLLAPINRETWHVGLCDFRLMAGPIAVPRAH